VINRLTSACIPAHDATHVVCGTARCHGTPISIKSHNSQHQEVRGPRKDVRVWGKSRNEVEGLPARHKSCHFASVSYSNDVCDATYILGTPSLS
jgi:hypothetical protein